MRIQIFIFGWLDLGSTELRLFAGFKEVVLGSIGYIFTYKIRLAKALCIPFVIYVLMDAALEVLPDISPGMTGLVVLGCLSIIVQAVVAVTTHRMVLLGPDSVSEWGSFKWSMRETSFLLRVVGLGVIVGLLSILGLFGIAGFGVALILMLWLAGRLSLVFPAIAIDKNITFKESWALTKDYQLLMVLAVIVFPIAVTIPVIMLLETVPYTFLLVSFVSMLATVLAVTALSVSYQYVFRGIPEQVKVNL